MLSGDGGWDWNGIAFLLEKTCPLELCGGESWSGDFAGASTCAWADSSEAQTWAGILCLTPPQASDFLCSTRMAELGSCFQGFSPYWSTLPGWRASTVLGALESLQVIPASRILGRALGKGIPSPQPAQRHLPLWQGPWGCLEH